MKDNAQLVQEIERITKLLKAAVQFREVSHRQIEREMGLSTGYLSRIFSGKVELRMEHVLGICAAVKLPPGAFFESVYPPRRLGRETMQLVAALQELMPAPEEFLSGDAGGTDQALPARRTKPAAPRASRDRMVRQMLELVLAEMEKLSEDDLP